MSRESNLYLCAPIIKMNASCITYLFLDQKDAHMVMADQQKGSRIVSAFYQALGGNGGIDYRHKSEMGSGVTN